MTILSLIRSNLFTLGLLLLIAGFSSSSWKSYTVYSSDNETYSGHQGLWYTYLSNDSVSCMGGLGFDTDSRARDSLHTVRNLLVVALGFSFLFLVICIIGQCSRDEDDDSEGFLNLPCCASLVFMLIIWTLVLSATLIYHQKIYAGSDDYQEVTRHHSGSFYVMVTSVALLGLAAIVCDGNLLKLNTTLIYAIITVLPKLICDLYETVPVDRRGRYFSMWLLHLGLLTLFSVGMFHSSWFSMTSTRYSDITVHIGMLNQCRNQYSLTCCSGITYFYTETPDWFFTCRDITVVAYSMCLLAVIFSSILLYVRTFRVPLLITQIYTGVALAVSCVQFGINIKDEEGVHSHFEAAFVINVIVSVVFLFFPLEYLIDKYVLIQPDSGIIQSSNRTARERSSASGQSWRESLLSWKERMTLLLIHRRSRLGAQIPVNDETVETECNICMLNPRDTRLHPCGHTCCRACAGQLERCHICRDLIQDNHIFYL
ncbi:uncharacterized protein LOC117321574 isoform X2 [Pecten maximus]|uniref:uncharacterized protein LOC117321574 isoform X2 n=1 Tax=Pecten maximus TaxID=6579 RepID=UPI0014582CE5|nr:uncharacterized protein LOC117321574 isoform X2 [Pecten maximus]